MKKIILFLLLFLLCFSQVHAGFITGYIVGNAMSQNGDELKNEKISSLIAVPQNILIVKCNYPMGDACYINNLYSIKNRISFEEFVKSKLKDKQFKIIEKIYDIKGDIPRLYLIVQIDEK